MVLDTGEERHCLCEWNYGRPLPSVIPAEISLEKRIEFLISLVNRHEGAGAADSSSVPPRVAGPAKAPAESAKSKLWTLRPGKAGSITLEDDDADDGADEPETPKRAVKIEAAALSPASHASTPRKLVSRTAGSGRGRGKRPREGTPVKKEQELQQEGFRIFLEADLAHADFQKWHRDAQGCNPQSEVKGHWQAFLRSLAQPSRVLGCEVCRALRKHTQRLLQRHQEQEQPPVALVAVPLVEDQPMEAGPRVHTRGRRAKTEEAHQRFDIHRFVQQRRQNIYQVTDNTYDCKKIPYFCVPCQRKVHFFASTNDSKLVKHEETDRRTAGLRRMQSEDAEAQETARHAAPLCLPPPQPAAEDEPGSQARKCSGLSIREPNTPISPVAESMRTFMLAGCPGTVFQKGEADPLAGVEFLTQDGDMRLRATECSGSLDGKKGKPCCKICWQTCTKPTLRKYVCRRAYLLDLAHLAWQQNYGTEEDAKAAGLAIQKADYRKLGLAGDDWQSIAAMESTTEVARCVLGKFEHVPKLRRSAALQTFMDKWLVRPQIFHAEDMEAKAHATLVGSFASAVASGKVQSRDLVLAAKVAAGELRQDSLISGLVSTFLFQYRQGLSNVCRKTSSSFIDCAALEDCLVTLGHKQETMQLLARFAVNPKALPRLQLDGVPFCSLRSQQELEAIAQRALSDLQLQGRRGHVILDETVWSANYEQVSGLRRGPDGTETAYVGGVLASVKQLYVRSWLVLLVGLRLALWSNIFLRFSELKPILCCKDVGPGMRSLTGPTSQRLNSRQRTFPASSWPACHFTLC